MGDIPLRARVLIISVFLLCGGLVDAQRTSDLPADYESVTLVGTLRGTEHRRFEITIDCIPLDRSSDRRTHSAPGAKLLGLATDGYKTRCVVDTFSLKLNGSAVNLPDKSRSDLADLVLPSGVYATSRGQYLVLHVKGGDGDTAYEARFIVDRQRLLARELDQTNKDGELETTRTEF